MIIGSKIYHKKKCYNSIKWAEEELASAQDGAVFLADVHEYCRGRMGSPWKFAEGQLAVTFVLKPDIWSKVSNMSFSINQLNMAISLGVLMVLKKYGIVFKWSNDFMYKNKKVGGILGKVIWKGYFPKGIIFAFAINVNNETPKLDQPYYSATTLSEIAGTKIDEKLLIKELFESIDSYYEMWLNSEYDKILNHWKDNQDYLGQKIKMHREDGTLASGIFEDVLSNGDLVLKTKKGQEVLPFFTVSNVFLSK